MIRRLTVWGVFLIFLLVSGASSGTPIMGGFPPIQEAQDPSLTERIRKRLSGTPGLQMDQINLRVEQGVVVISGQAEHLLAKDRATRMVQRTRGVQAVVNNLVVRSTRSDEAIQQDLRHMLEHTPTTLKWNVWTKVQDNVVTLDGLVDSWRKRAYLEDLVKQIKGVIAIRNNIEIARRQALSDAELESDIEHYLRWDKRIQSDQLNVIVDQRKAILIGSVPNAYQKQLAIEKSHIPGIKEVDASNLDISPSANAPSGTGSGPSPEQIQKAIKQALSYDPRIGSESMDVEIEVRQDSVHLSGTVDHLIAKQAIGKITAHTSGVRVVENDLSIDEPLKDGSAIPITDKAILRRTQEALRRNPYVRLQQINVQVENGIIRLTGAVSSTYEKIHAGDVAAQIMGALGVNNDIEVRKGT